MRYNTLILLAAGMLGFSQSSFATVTLQFSQTSVGRATGFANNAGTPTNGMRWGIVVDGSGNGFGAGNYDVFDNTTSGFLSASSTVTDDFFVTTGLLTSNQTATGTDPGGTGGITSLASIFAAYPAGVGSGDAFRIIWFESTPAAGSFYGMFADALFTLPPDGNTQSYASVFAGAIADPAKPANLQFPGTIIPEPSRALLIGFGLVGLFLRRKR